MPHASVAAVEYYLPEHTVSSEDLAREFPEWSAQKIEGKTGVWERHTAAPDECSSDLAIAAAQRLFTAGADRPENIDYLLFCTQSPDHFLPTTACLIQDRLGIPVTAGALDYNLGCSGYVYGLGLAEGLIASGQASRVLLLTGETYSKFLNPKDRSMRTIFGDAGSATLLSATDGEPRIGPFVYGTDGRGGPNLIVPAGGLRRPKCAETAIAAADESGNVRSAENLYMNGAELFAFALDAVPASIEQVLRKASLVINDVDLFIFHQTTRYVLDQLRRRVDIPEDRFYVRMSHCGNTVSSTIPIALKHAAEEGRLRAGMRVMLVGFGVGYSWGAALLRWGAGPAAA